jgi:hypothetical protein
MNSPIEKRKVFGVGLNKTGTTSLEAALNLLGIRTVHYPFKRATYDELTSGSYRLSIMETFQAAVDTSVAPFYPQLDREYPGSRFILTQRDPESWLRSIECHWPVMREWCEREPQFGRFTDFISAVVYGSIGFHRDRFLYAYKTHERNVREYFRDRPEDLLVIDICNGHGWEKLCPFLGLEIPAFPFPHSNRGKDREATVCWIQQFDRAQSDLAALLPRDAPLILIDDGKVGPSIVPGARVLPYPAYNAQPCGLPQSADEAVAGLRRLHASGAEVVVLTWESFWWLEQYPEFEIHLQTQYRCLLKNDCVAVYKLSA